MAKKRSFVGKLKDWWPVTIAVIAAFGWLVSNSSNLMAVWNTPKKQAETEQSVQEYASKLDSYTAANEAANKQRDQMIQMFAQYTMEKK